MRVRPDRIQQLVGGYEPAGVRREVPQYVPGLGPQLDGLCPTPQPRISEVETKRSEFDHSPGCGGHQAFRLAAVPRYPNSPLKSRLHDVSTNSFRVCMVSTSSSVASITWDALSDPYRFDDPQDWIVKTGPRNLTHCWATETDEPPEVWGKVGRQQIEDEGPLAPFLNMTGRQRWHEVVRPSATWRHSTSCSWITPGRRGQGEEGWQALLHLAHTTCMHVFTYIPPKYEAMNRGASAAHQGYR